MNHDDPTGIAPAAVRSLACRYVAEMTAPPATAGPGDLRRIEHADGQPRMRCPIWTETGRSRLAKDFVIRWRCPEPEFDFDNDLHLPDVCIEQVVDTETGLVVLTECDAPASDCLHPNDPLAGTGEDPRIRRNALVDDSMTRRRRSIPPPFHSPNWILGPVCGSRLACSSRLSVSRRPWQEPLTLPPPVSSSPIYTPEQRPVDGST